MRAALRLLTASCVLMMTSAKISSNYPPQVQGLLDQRTSKAVGGHWAPWSSWTPCSRTCGGGVAIQTRECRPSDVRRRRRIVTETQRNQCVGIYKRVHLCNEQDCPPNSKDFRQAQCESYNGKQFMGRLYLWEPFLQAPNPCELNCRAVGFRFYATLNKTAADGTPCQGSAPQPTKHVCVAGTCQRVGCDGIVGSGRTLDACGVCGGDNSACRRVAGLFTRPTLPQGYNLVATVPRGACNVSVSELRPTRNSLALRRPDGTFVLNGAWGMARPGDYDGFQYRRQDPEMITSSGPLRYPVDIMIIYHEPNPGIKYEYMLPMKVENERPHAGSSLSLGDDATVKDNSAVNGADKRFPYGSGVLGTESQSDHPMASAEYPAPSRRRKRKFSWRMTGLTECSQSCAGGIQTTIWSCVRETNQQVVHDRKCQEKKPQAQTRHCNTKPCPADWVAGEWGPCSVSCGKGGSQTRSIMCKQKVTSELNMVVADGACLSPLLLSRVQSCDSPPCPGQEPEWRTGPWGQCSSSCGLGNRTRVVTCQGPQGANGNECPQSDRPAEEELCDMGPCSNSKGSHAPWLFTEWSQQCSHECGTGLQTRRVHCSGGQESSCDAKIRPEEKRACSSQRHCAGQWFAGPWGQCLCGLGQQTRSVVCISTLRGQQRVVHDSNCPSSLRPQKERDCQAASCGVQWFLSDWSQCSRPCGTGEQSREVHCMDEKMQPSERCPEELRPPVRRTCNTHDCGTTTDPPPNESEKRTEQPYPKEKDSPLLSNGVGDQPSADSHQGDSHHKGGDCEDKFQNCHLVVQARLCRFKYYHANCCHSCKKRN